MRQCREWGEQRHQECCDWPPCSWFCDAIVWVIENVCVGWTTIVSTVCESYHTVVETVCIIWEWVVRTTCVIWGVIVRAACAAWGWVTKFLCPLAASFDVRIAESHDEPAAPSTPRFEATSMSVARVAAETEFADSGTRFFFRIRNGQVQFRTAFSDWALVEPSEERGPEAVSYHDHRSGDRLDPVPAFDMIAADSGRVFVKECGRARFYFTMLEPMFRRQGNSPVPSAYFKLDPEQGLDAADNADRVRHLPAENDSDHPAAVRFPLFRAAMQIDQNDSMVVNIDANRAVWHRIDARPPKDAPDPPATGDFPGVPPTEDVVVYEQRGLPGFGPHRIARRGYRMHRVLDLGVGHEHWHEQRCRIYGGEMDSLDGPGLRFVLPGRDVYRMFNGPVDDQGGFIDGTINYYVLAQLVPDREISAGAASPVDAFGILWLDEQAVLSERWRLASPDDSRFGGFRDIIPSAMVQYMDKDFAHFRFDRGQFWDPMRDGHVTRDSRMAVSRQVIILSGRNPKTGQAELFSINFSFGTSDRTWRWRRFPPKTDIEAAFDLREDMMLFVRAGANKDSGYWFQRYLPASGRMTPNGLELRLAEGADRPDRTLNIAKPREPLDHPWQWLPSDVFEFIHTCFSHFGCFEDHVNWRWQYYRVDVTDDAALRARDEGTPWTELSNALSIRKASLNWQLLNALLNGDSLTTAGIDATLWSRLMGALATAATGTLSQNELAELMIELQNTQLVRQTHVRGLFNPEFVLKLIYREPLGWLLLHWDKRDDDLLPFGDMTTLGGTPIALEIRPGLPPAAGPLVSLQVRSYHQVLDPPAVDEARVLLLLEGEYVRRIRVELRPSEIQAPIDENIWRIKLGALRRDPSGTLINAERFLDEVRIRAPVQDEPRPGWLGYEWNVANWRPERLERVRECCSKSGCLRFGTRLWFENVVGHVAPPDFVEYLETNVKKGGDSN